MKLTAKELAAAKRQARRYLPGAIHSCDRCEGRGFVMEKRGPRSPGAIAGGTYAAVDCPKCGGGR